MRNKIVSAEEAAALVREGDTICTTGFVQSGIAEEILIAIEKRFLETGQPRDLTVVAAAGQADSKEKGLNRLGHEGLLRRYIGGNWGRVPKIVKLAMEEKISGYNLPQGVITHLYRDQAAGKPGTFTKIGLHTFVDPRLEGGRVNDKGQKGIVHVVEVDGEEWLFYQVRPINVAIIRGTTADPMGNITMEKESLTLDCLAMAMAAKNSNGIVLAQVERIAERGSLNPRHVHVPGIMVDCVVVAAPENHMQSYATQYNPAYSGEIRVPLESLKPMDMDERKVIARRAAFELPPNGIVNLGVGIPDGVAAVAAEERILGYITLTTEAGSIGGAPAGGADFGAAVNADAVIDQNQMFDFYDGGGLDMTCLGLAEVDESGNVNVSRFGTRIIGCGGFINISQNARTVVFAGTFTAGGLEVAVEDGKLRIVKEGKSKKFVKKVQQVTFSGDYAQERGQPVFYVTERCVFRRGKRGLNLIEVAPGIDIERDILAHMDFEPIVREPQIMDPRIFRPELMGLEKALLNLDLEDRISCDRKNNIMFLNFEGLHLRTRADIDNLRSALVKYCEQAGRKVGVVVNYDSFRINEEIIDPYAEMIQFMQENYYTTITRYTTSAFMRRKVGEELRNRNMAPHVFESKEEAHAFLAAHAEEKD
ncbi:MAG: acyl CoA:acetate/3-ketoacid CoA transferase [Alphaproteobacteria bacterium]|nr:acyl CoA:acetate/3-ketoacid CoA transferase [Alphaproteobacteria bacterium]